MKRIFVILAAVLMLPALAMAQDDRNRTVTTVIADALAQLPAQDQKLYDSLMDDLAGTGSEGVAKLAGMLVPADKGKNATVEYALNGLTAYVTAPGRESMSKNMSQGLVKAIGECSDDANKRFLISLLGACGDGSSIGFLEKYLDDSSTMDPALNAIMRLPGGKEAVVRLVNESREPNPVLACAAAEVGAAALEDRLIAWAQQAPAGQKRDYYRSLSRVGGLQSFKLLERAAKAAGYRYDADDAASAYTAMLSEGAGKGFDAQLLKSAKHLLKSGAPVHMRGAALAAVFGFEKKKALPELIKAVKNGSRQYRVNALRLSQPWADAEVYAAVNKAASAARDAAAKIDVINWYAANGTQSQIDYVTAAITQSNPDAAAAAIKAAAMIGGDKALKALAAQLYGANREKAAEALLYFDGDISGSVNAAFDSSDAAVKSAAIGLADKRHVKASMPNMLRVIRGSDSGQLKSAAYRALANVASAEDLGELVTLAAKASGEDRAAVAKAVKAVLTSKPRDEQYAALKPYLDRGGDISIFYPALAQCGSKEAVKVLRNAGDKGDKEAFAALLTVDGNDMIPILYQIATTDSDAKVPALKRYASLARRSGYNGSRLFDIYTKGLALTDDAEVQNLMIEGLGQSRVFPALAVALEYIDKPETAAASAAAIRNVASKNYFTGSDVVKALEAAKAYYQAEGSADSGYAVDDINKMIDKMTYNPVFKLSPEEEAEGFELLFDGTSLDRWKGSKSNYVPVDGAIFVTAQYGGNGNLYTDKEYSDFIYRFEFCFDSPGVNNGVGIRTTENVDAAYYGMEIQVLEHDAPIYADLRPYQVHGSVYGIIPAKRIVSPKPGVWNTEEIRAVGDHITVTVNGEVIVDGNIRKACKGHNVAPDGSRVNPYTVDHLNHPGLFNKKGLISFCGHGPGVRFRNIRIKDLSKE